MSTNRRTRIQNVRRRGDSYTYYAYVAGPDGQRRQISKGGFATIKEAEAARVEVLSSINRGTFVLPERITLEEFLVDEWLPTKLPPTLEESTYVSYEGKLRRHVIPRVGRVQLQQLTPIHLNQLYRDLLNDGRCKPGYEARRHSPEIVDYVAEQRKRGKSYQEIADDLRARFPDAAGDATRHTVSGMWRRAQAEVPTPRHERQPGLSPRTVRYVHTILHAALKDALRWNRVARNVADAATPPPTTATKAPRPQHWTAEQLGRFLNFVGDSRYLPAWMFLATSGCRRGECLGLGWSDVNLDAGTAVLARQLVSINHEVKVKELPKTKRAHLIRLDSGTVEMLRRWRAQQNEEKLLAGPGYVDQDFVFALPNGRPYDPDRFSREFVRQQERYNRGDVGPPLPRLVLHGLRHTWATLALEEGIDVKIVSERLNHSSTHVTQEIYTHVTPPMQSDAAERVASRILDAP